MSRLSGMQTSPCLQIVITLEHLITKAAQCLSNKTTRRLSNSLKKHSEMTRAAQRLSTIWVALLVVLNNVEIRTYLINPSLFSSVGTRFNLQEAEQTGGLFGLLFEASCHLEEQYRSHVPAGQPVSFQ